MEVLGIIQDKSHGVHLKSLYRSLDQYPTLIPPLLHETPEHRVKRKDVIINLAINRIHETHGPNYLTQEEDAICFFHSIQNELAVMHNDTEHSKIWAKSAIGIADKSTPPPLQNIPSAEIAEANKTVMSILKQTRAGWSRLQNRIIKDIDKDSRFCNRLPEERYADFSLRMERMIALAINHIHETHGPKYLLSIPNPLNMEPPIIKALRTLDHAHFHYESLSRPSPSR